MSDQGSEKVRVIVRVRPFNAVEEKEGSKRCVTVNKARNEILVAGEGAEKKQFTFDGVYDEGSQQIDLYNEAVRPIVSSVLEGYNGTVFAYGQTGAGKTFTMEGKDSPKELRGITFNSFNHIFETIADYSVQKNFIATVTMVEIYNEEIRDLIGNSRNKLELKEEGKNGFVIKGANTPNVSSTKDLDRIINIGRSNRSVAATRMNETSSRSHCLILLQVESHEVGEDGEPRNVRSGKLNLVDLAGSERAKKTGATGDKLKEGALINQSLSTLGAVISALVQARTHVPYRNSKLTRLLQDSLGGNTKTVMVANISPADYNLDETISTLRYANRAKQIQNRPIINMNPDKLLVKKLEDEVKLLKDMLEKSALTPQAINEQIKATAVSEDELNKLKQQKDEEIERMKEDIKNQSNEEKKALLAQIEKEKIQIEDELKIKHAEAEEQAKKKEKLEKENSELAKRLKSMENKMIHGQQANDEKIKQKHREQELMIKRQKEELERNKQNEEELKRELREREENRLELADKYSSIQDEVEIKTKKLNKLWKLYQTCKNDIKELQLDFDQEREALSITLGDSERDRKLYKRVVELFVPPEELQKIMARAFWDDNAEEWSVMHSSLSGNGIRLSRPSSATGEDQVPVTEWAKVAAIVNSGNPRFKNDNMVQLELEMPERTTQDYIPTGYDHVSYSPEDEMGHQQYGYDEEVQQRRAPSQHGKRPKTASKKRDQY
ncbi:kinesin family member [Acrasis kona]|uniref:Kinesin-like protein n=1 Tax=Acrasis kona TaxID=1008807 RepID=A0AAW2ZGZ2_9EUKA